MPQFSWRAAAVLAALCLGTAGAPRAQAPRQAPLDGWFVADPVRDGVVVLLSEGGELYVPIRAFDAAPVRTATTLTRPAVVIDMPASLTTRLVGNRVHLGEPWTIDSADAGRLHAVVDHFVLGYKNCGEAWGVFLKAEPLFQGRPPSISSGQYLARPGAFFAPSGRMVGSLQRHLSEPERGELAMLLEQARRQTIGDVRHRWGQGEPQRLANPALRDWDARWTDLDKGLDRHDARLTFDDTLFRLTPDGDPRVFVQARWTVHGSFAYALTMWARLSGSHVTVESVDPAPATLLRAPEMEAVTIDRTTSRVLGVFDVNGDGRAELLLLRPGYESIDRDLIEYPAPGPAQPRVLSHYGDGC